MRFRYLLLLSFCAILSGIIIIYPYLPRFLSFQDYLPSTNLISEIDPNAKTAIFNNQYISIPTESFSDSKVLGDSDPFSSKRIEVDLTTQTLTAYQNDSVISSFKISSGTWDRTPPGIFHIWAKIKSQKMSGGSKELGTYYYLPNVPYIMFFYNDQIDKRLGFSIHGAYWHNNFGVPMSHGCINMKTAEAKVMFEWADMSTPIIIFGKYQKS
jgi:hypothetical protein